MYVDDDSNDGIDGNAGNGGDSDGDTEGSGNGDDAAAAADGNNVDEDDGGDLRTTIRRRQLDKDNGTATMRWSWVASDMQDACKCCIIHQKQ